MSPAKGQHILLLHVFMLCCCMMPTSTRHLTTDDINAQLLSTIEDTMDLRADPCKNFYRFTCGNWKRIMDSVDMILNLNYMFIEDISQLLEEEEPKSNKPEVQELFGKLKDFYGSCQRQNIQPEKVSGKLPEESIRATFLKRYFDLIKPTDEDDWPVNINDTWQPKNKWNIWSTMGRLATYGFNHLFFDMDFRQNSEGELYEAELRMHEITPLLSLYFQDRKEENELSNFVEELWEIQENGDVNKEWTISELQQELPYFDFPAYAAKYLDNVDISSVKVTVYNVEYFRAMTELVHRTSTDVLIQVVKKAFEFYMNTLAPWKLTCGEMLRQMLTLALDYVYDHEVYTHVRGKTDAVMHKIYESLRQKLLQQFDKNVNEFTEPEVQALKDKLLDMKLIIGNLPLNMDDATFLEYFKGWVVVKDDYHLNVLNLLKYNSFEIPRIKFLQKFRPILHLFQRAPVSPFYLDYNQVVIPHAYIRFPMFQPDFHELFMYAELGNSMGHEIMHAFGPEGLSFGLTANVSLSDKPEFLTKVACFNQTRTSSIIERICDYDGFRLSYETFFNQSNVSEVNVSSKWTNKQLYFIKFSQLFCGGSAMYDDSHDSPYRRVFDNAHNSKEFSEVFSCPERTQAKCTLWWDN